MTRQGDVDSYMIATETVVYPLPLEPIRALGMTGQGAVDSYTIAIKIGS